MPPQIGPVRTVKSPLESIWEVASGGMTSRLRFTLITLFLNNFPSNSNGGIQGIPAYVDTKTNDYGHIACTLLCAKDVVCPYHKTNPTFNPELQRQQSYKPMDYISPAELQEIQAARDVKCEKKGNNFVVPEGKGKYCFLCASEELGLTVPVIGADNFNEIVFTTSFGPSVGVLWSVLVFEHIVFAIKFFVMSLIPDVTDEIEDQLVGHDTYRRRLAMSRNVKPHESVSSYKPQAGLVASLDAVNAQSGTALDVDDDSWDPRPMTLEMVKQTFAGQHEVQYSQSKRNQALNSGEV